MKDYLKIVVTGEVDSGKSTLIGRFLYEMGSVSKETIEEIAKACQRLEGDFEFAYLLDSFEEERKNQLTIDTTQVFCKNKKGRSFLFIDVPGHRELLKNMLCGSSYADIAILVVDIEKSVEEGTKRHVNILKFLGIEQIILILNKIDLVKFNKDVFIQAKENIDKFSKKTGIQFKYLIPVSAKQGDNIIKKSSKTPWYKSNTLIDALNVLNKGSKEGKGHEFYFPIQDIYSTNGEKICVGNIISGKIKKGEIVKILPLNDESKIKEIKVFNKSIFWAKAPESIGLILTDQDNLQRGQVVCKGNTKVTNQILAKIFCVHPLSIGQDLIFKCTTQQTPAKIKQINKIFDTASLEVLQQINNINESNAAEVIIKTENPVVVEKFIHLNNLGRFVLQNNRKEICAVGVIF